MIALWIGAGILGWIAVAVPVGLLVGRLIRRAENQRVHPGRADHQGVDHGGRQLADGARDPTGPDRM